MQVEFKDAGVRGGSFFPGLARPFAFEADELREADAEMLRNLVDAARFFEQPSMPAVDPARGGPGQGQHVITIEQGDRRHTVMVPESRTRK